MGHGLDWLIVPTRVLPFIVVVVSWCALHNETIRRGQVTLWSVFTLLSFLPVPFSILALSYQQPVVQQVLFFDLGFFLMPSMIASAVVAGAVCSFRSSWSLWLGSFWTGSIVGAATAASLHYYFFVIKSAFDWFATFRLLAILAVSLFVASIAAFLMSLRTQNFQNRLGLLNGTAARRNALVILWVCSVLLVPAYRMMRLPSAAFVAAIQAEKQANLRWKPLGWSARANGDGLLLLCLPGGHLDLTTVGLLKVESPPVNSVWFFNTTLTDEMALELSTIESITFILMEGTSISDQALEILRSQPRLRIEKREPRRY